MATVDSVLAATPRLPAKTRAPRGEYRYVKSSGGFASASFLNVTTFRAE
jgi:hypothetical protein